MERVILHIDFDSFFASVAQQDNPRLRSKPIGVTATNGRTCIIAASREAKRYGVKTGTRTFEALRLCPGIIFVPSDFIRYLAISKVFLSICKDFSPFVELFSIDEVFMDVTKTTYLFGGVQGIIAKIRERLRKEIGAYVTVSVGISHNKLLAKLASGMKKPNGIMSITPEHLDAVYAKTPLFAICGIGHAIEARLVAMSITTLLQLRAVPLANLVAEFGPSEGQFLKNIGNGYDSSLVIPYTTFQGVKSVGRNYCLPKNEFDQRIILQNVYELCEEVGIKLRRLDKQARTVGLSLRGTRSEHGRKTLMQPIDQGRILYSLCKGFYDAWQWDNVHATSATMVRQISVWATNLTDTRTAPLSLLPDVRRQQGLQKTIDILNDRFGDHTIRNGFLLYADKLTTVPNGYMADRFERREIARLK